MKKIIIGFVILFGSCFSIDIEQEMIRILNLPGIVWVKDISVKKFFSYELRWFVTGWQGKYYLASARVKPTSIILCTITEITEKQAQAVMK